MNTKLIQTSFEKVKPIANEVISHFYDRLFATYPDAKKLFTDVDMEKQKKALLGSLAFAVENIENPGKLVPALKQMGARHFDYGVEDTHYSLVGECLLATFAHFFKDEWTKELEDSWAEAYEFMASVMIEAGQERRDVMTTASAMAHKLLHAAFKIALTEETFAKLAQQEARKLLERAMEQEVERALKGGSPKRVA